MQGSHIPYHLYDEQDEKLITTKEYTEYDRTIHHTDRTLNKIINVVKKYDEETVIYYFSDHGEIVNKGHAIIKDENTDQYKIPIIIFQNKFNVDVTKIIDKYRSNNHIFNNLNLPYVIIELLGYDVSDKLVKEAKYDGNYVYHADGFPYKFDDIKNNIKP